MHFFFLRLFISSEKKIHPFLTVGMNLENRPIADLQVAWGKGLRSPQLICRVLFNHVNCSLVFTPTFSCSLCPQIPNFSKSKAWVIPFPKRTNVSGPAGWEGLLSVEWMRRMTQRLSHSLMLVLTQVWLFLALGVSSTKPVSLLALFPSISTST